MFIEIMANELFEIAARKKYRFPFNGQISAEDLWDLSPAQLDRVFKILKKDQKTGEEESLMNTRTSEDTTLDNKIALVKYIFETKQAEKLAAERKAEENAKKARIREIIADKKEEALKGMSIEELEKLLDT